MKEILIIINDIHLKANLLDTPTSDAIYSALPIDGYAQTWGDEIYFGTPVKMDEEPDAKEEVEVGTLAFWPPGSAFCIFFGRTPASTGEKPCAASPVNFFGKIESDLDVLKKVRSGDFIQVKKL